MGGGNSLPAGYKSVRLTPIPLKKHNKSFEPNAMSKVPSK